MTTNSVLIKDMESRIEEDRALLEASSARVEEKEANIFELEEQINKLQAQRDKDSQGQKMLQINFYNYPLLI